MGSRLRRRLCKATGTTKPTMMRLHESRGMFNSHGKHKRLPSQCSDNHVGGKDGGKVPVLRATVHADGHLTSTLCIVQVASKLLLHSLCKEPITTCELRYVIIA